MIAPKKNRWGKRLFTPRQWLRRDIASANTRAAKDAKTGKRPVTGVRLAFLEKKEVGE